VGRRVVGRTNQGRTVQKRTARKKCGRKSPVGRRKERHCRVERRRQGGRDKRGMERAENWGRRCMRVNCERAEVSAKRVREGKKDGSRWM